MGMDLLQYIVDLFDHWAAFMTGGIPVALLALWERWRGRNVSFRFYVAVFLIFGFSAASFQTWRAAKTELTGLQGGTSPANRVAMKNLIGVAISQTDELLKNWDTKDPDSFKHEANFWTNRVGYLVEHAYGKGEAFLVMSDAGYISYTDGKKQTELRNWIIHRLQRLNDLMARVDSLSLQPGFDPQNYHWVDTCDSC
jgi:hypothetical protein